MWGPGCTSVCVFRASRVWLLDSAWLVYPPFWGWGRVGWGVNMDSCEKMHLSVAGFVKSWDFHFLSPEHWRAWAITEHSDDLQGYFSSFSIQRVISKWATEGVCNEFRTCKLMWTFKTGWYFPIVGGSNPLWTILFALVFLLWRGIFILEWMF